MSRSTSSLARIVAARSVTARRTWVAPTSAASTTRAAGLKANWAGGRPPDDVASPAVPTSALASRASTRWATVERPRPVAAASSLRVRGTPSRRCCSSEPAPSTAHSETHPLPHFQRDFCLTTGRSVVGSRLDPPRSPGGTRGRRRGAAPARQRRPDHMRTSRKRMGVAALAVTALTLAAACGDDDDDEAGGDTTPPAGRRPADDRAAHRPATEAPADRGTGRSDARPAPSRRRRAAATTSSASATPSPATAGGRR